MNALLITASIGLFAASGAALAGPGHDGSGTHAHASWEKPPAEYASKVAKNWDDTSAALRGKKLYEQNCMACHGADGKGTGPAAAALEHAPADLTNNFHTAPGEGDGYLFWRISEGGLVEPYSSMNSSMPAFKDSMSEAQRWDVLVYVHQEFHVAFPTPAVHKGEPHRVKKKSSSGGHDH